MYYNDFFFCRHHSSTFYALHLLYLNKGPGGLGGDSDVDSSEFEPWSDLSADFSAERLKPLPLPKIIFGKVKI
jgi:hypothetical protein